MTDLNKQELRRLAEAAIPDAEWFRVHDLCHPNIDGSAAKFVAKATPAAILALLDELAQAKCEAGHAIQQKDAAYSKCSELRADLERQTELRRLEWNRAEALRACLRETTAVAIAMHTDTCAADVFKTFSITELAAVVDVSEPLAEGGSQAEDVYRRAWDMSAPQEASHD